MIKEKLIRRLGALCMAAALLMSAAACADNDGKAKVSGTDGVSPSDMSVGIDDGTPLPCGVWAADDGEQRTGYYFVMKEGSGAYLDTEQGIGVAFEVEIDGKEANFHMGAADVNDVAALRIVENNQRKLTWKLDQREENLTLIVGEDPHTFGFYAASELSEAARAAYVASNGSVPQYVGYTVETDGTVVIRLFDDEDGNDVVATYRVNSLTGKGTWEDGNEGVDFSRKAEKTQMLPVMPAA